MDIPEIQVDQSSVQQINVHSIAVPVIRQIEPPVTLNIGFPIVNIPGCVDMHQDNQMHKNGLPLDKDLVNNDPKQVTTLCPSGEYPSYNAMNYEPEQLIITREAPPPPVAPPPETPDTPQIPDTGGITPETECPAPNQPRVGDLTQDGSEKVIGHELQGTTCVVLYEDTTAIEKYLPTSNQVSTTASIAVVATAAAAATPLLLRVVKPVIKKLWTTIQKKLGKTPTRLSRNDVIANNYRAKKGLPPFKVKEYR
tara:strand:+ start:563 stop:1321 length:759 start_codon:yes stop_codon:yes gene_type:complete